MTGMGSGFRGKEAARVEAARLAARLANRQVGERARVRRGGRVRVEASVQGPGRGVRRQLARRVRDLG